MFSESLYHFLYVDLEFTFEFHVSHSGMCISLFDNTSSSSLMNSEGSSFNFSVMSTCFGIWSWGSGRHK